jgi:small subunit ribosomal protein S35
MEDIPADSRHHTVKVKPKFPVEWRLTEERKKELDAYRERVRLIESQKEHQGLLVDGVAAFQKSVAAEIGEEMAQAGAEAAEELMALPASMPIPGGRRKKRSRR